MATLVFQAAGAALGSVFGPVGTIIGRAAGGLAGAAIDRSLLGGGASSRPSLKDLDVTASTEGTPVSRVWGRGRVSGQIIWATRLEAVVSRRSAGGKGLTGAGQSAQSVSYYANVALGLCEGPVARIGRVWADGKPLDTIKLNLRLYTGAEDQEPDPLIIAKEGAGNAPAYRGLAYAVFERLPLEDFGNRIPQLSFEVIRPVGMLERNIRSMCLIPGSTEFGYDTRTVSRTLGLGETASENRHTRIAATDLEASLDELEALCPNLENVSLVVAWFGDDLRCGTCMVTPRTDSRDKRTAGVTWEVAGLTRATARTVSSIEGRAAYGGSPSDAGVIRAIQAIKARGWKVTLYPFLMMDVPADNDLPHPVTGIAPQPAYTWRGEIAAAGRGDAVARDEVARFFGVADADDFSVRDGRMVYRGPADWGWRRFVLHMSALGEAAGGVDAVIIGSEFRDLTRSRDDEGAYPAVAELVKLADEVRRLCGAGTRITYAADWTEYGAHVPGDGAEVRFPLDPLWAHSAVDAVGIDLYAPLADWRSGTAHRDRAVSDSIYDAAYLAANVAGGEAYHWFYASDEDRAAQRRAPITDGFGKEWTFRQKDLANWWRNAHHERVDGQEMPQPTAWVPGSKPIWLTEIGCPAVDKGANAPNVFPDIKMPGAALPPFSAGGRDDAIQRRAIEALLAVYGEESDANPASSVYGMPMVDPAWTSLWAWDARPFPAFPSARDVWADGAAHETGHWLTGRLGQAPLAELAAQILEEGGAPAFDTMALEGVVDGYVIDRPASAREALEPLGELFAFGARERDGRIVLAPRGRGSARVLTTDNLAADGEGAEPSYLRAQESELPAGIAIGFEDVALDFAPSLASVRRRGVDADGIVASDTALVAGLAEMRRRAAIRLQDVWVGRESASFALPPSMAEVEPGDLVSLDGNLFEIGTIADGPLRRCSARAIAPEIFEAPPLREGRMPTRTPVSAGPGDVVLLDLPAPGDDPPVLTRIAIAAKPWPGAMNVWQDKGGTFQPILRVGVPAILGTLLEELAAGPVWRFDGGHAVQVRVSGELMSASDARLFEGANAAAVQNADGSWEVLQFGRAELVAAGTYRLSRFLRGQSGTEAEAQIAKPAGSRFVLLDEGVQPLIRGVEALGRPMDLHVSPAGRDFADDLAIAVRAEPGAVALRPLSPVHLQAERRPDGLLIRWIRRARLNGDSWEMAEVPLAEEREAYRVEILRDGQVVRGVEVGEPRFLYAPAEESVDFGVGRHRLRVRLMQISASVGAGRAVEGVFDV
ncbi:baseplate multidomain protein megatron [Terrihabitans sp. B22-R8]|uniref:baseplate multidomain protein megatron n=1 Tax=Terrihabitans sp. B22-R8 TaxID=3425128 RepID=UPI00403CC77D